MRRSVVTAPGLPKPVADALAVLRKILTTWRYIGAIAFAMAVAYVLLCLPETQMREREPEGWQLVYGSSPLSPIARCTVFCVGAALCGLIPLFIALYIKQWRQRSRSPAA